MRRAIAIALVTLCWPALSSARGPSTPEERKRAIETTRRLEREPLARSGIAARDWLLKFIIEAPDFQVKGCSGPLDVLAQNEDAPYARLLYLQSIFGMAAFVLENPKKANDWAAVQTAGIESTLRTYQSILRADSDARWGDLDRLVESQKAGKLRKLVEKEMAGCPKDEGDGGPAPRDAI